MSAVLFLRLRADVAVGFGGLPRPAASSQDLGRCRQVAALFGELLHALHDPLCLAAEGLKGAYPVHLR